MNRHVQLGDRLLQILKSYPDRKLVVVGDLIADQFLYGQISRISREAPVLVLQYRGLSCLPGGGANAANNLLALGCRVRVVGAVGDDDAGRSLLEALSGCGADVTAVRKFKGYDTPLKTRILAGAHHSAPQQIVRVDRTPEQPGKAVTSRAGLRNRMQAADAIIISDYGYGAVDANVVEALVRIARRRRIPLVLDSRFRMGEFKGVTSITPNITELEAAVGMRIGNDPDLLHKAARGVIASQRLDHLLVTQGKFGMTLFQKRRKPLHIPIYGTDEVADVTGAGDTVIAVFTLSLSCGATPEEAARLANYAGGIVVMKRGTATIQPEELRRAILSDLKRSAG